MDELFAIVRRFREAEIEFVLIGGLAMVAHGCTHYTGDADFSFATDDENCDRIVALLQPHRPRPLAWSPSNPFTMS